MFMAANKHEQRGRGIFRDAGPNNPPGTPAQKIRLFKPATPIQHSASLFQNPDGAFLSEMDPFAREVRQLSWIGANTAGQDALRQPALTFTEIAKPKSARSLS